MKRRADLAGDRGIADGFQKLVHHSIDEGGTPGL